MKKVNTASTVTALWFDYVKEAEQVSGQQLAEDLEHYLVLTLERFMDQPAMTSSVLALDFLSAQSQLKTQQHVELRAVGDKCLLFSGLFPERASRLRVSVNYFVELGQSAYIIVADLAQQDAKLAQLFELLGAEFVQLMDLLQCMRTLGTDDKNMSLMQAIELWHDTRSAEALKVIQQYRPGFVPPSYR